MDADRRSARCRFPGGCGEAPMVSRIRVRTATSDGHTDRRAIVQFSGGGLCDGKDDEGRVCAGETGET